MDPLTRSDDSWPHLFAVEHGPIESPAPPLSTAGEQLERSRPVELLLDHDELTRLLSRRAVLDRARALVERLRREPHRRACWAMVDVDHFRAIVECHGQAAADRLLVATAALLLRRLGHLEAPSHLGRLDGDEFAVLLEDRTPRQAWRLLNHVRKELAALEHHLPGLAPLHATLSVGIAVLGAGMEVERWHERAERALCVAKVAGRNRVELIV